MPKKKEDSVSMLKKMSPDRKAEKTKSLIVDDELAGASVEEKKKEPLFWIEGLPPLNRNIQDLYQIAYDRDFMHEIGSGYESDWDIDARVGSYHSYISGKKRISIEDLESIIEFLKTRIYECMSPLSAEAISYIAEIE